eukprot:TRINITY_DN2201_c0_g1_i2.p1 TRINITY_DN2201_c0_g1~~TRINITY_DN2201_c0_g1_i2.p1  ORF type:complete len:531 (+),score=76.89 TRINITY_DN2201_c0_g1_i2:221-1594(+)
MRNYLENLRRFFKLHIIFDGVFEPIKEPTRRNRRKTRFNALRNNYDDVDYTSIGLYRYSMVQLLMQMEISFEVAISEADRYTARSCIENDGIAVLAEDSDYFILQVSYIPLSTVSMNGNNFIAQLYSPETVNCCLRINECRYPVLASLCGNDYFQEEDLKQINSKLRISNLYGQKRIRHLLNLLRKTNSPSINRHINSNKLRKKYVSSKNKYDINYHDQNVSEIDLDDTIEPSLLNSHKSGQNLPSILGILSSKKYWYPIYRLSGPYYRFAYKMTEKLRNLIYTSLFPYGETITEVHCSGKKKNVIDFMEGISLAMDINEPSKISLINFLCPDQVDYVLSLDDELQLLACLFIYFKVYVNTHNNAIFPNCYFNSYSKLVTYLNNDEDRKMNCPEEGLYREDDTLISFCSTMCILFEIGTCINDLAGRVFYTLRIDKCMDWELMQYFLENDGDSLFAI